MQGLYSSYSMVYITLQLKLCRKEGSVMPEHMFIYIYIHIIYVYILYMYIYYIYVIVIPWARVLCLIYTHKHEGLRPECECVYTDKARVPMV